MKRRVADDEVVARFHSGRHVVPVVRHVHLTGALAQRFQRQGKNSLVLWAFKDNAFRRFYDRLGGEIVAEGHDDGIADIAYGWRDIGTLVAACGGAADMLKTASDACR